MIGALQAAIDRIGHLLALAESTLKQHPAGFSEHKWVEGCIHAYRHALAILQESD